MCSDHKLLRRDSYKGVGHASTLPDSILHKMMIIISYDNNFFSKVLTSNIKQNEKLLERNFRIENILMVLTIYQKISFWDFCLLSDGTKCWAQEKCPAGL